MENQTNFQDKTADDISKESDQPRKAISLISFIFDVDVSFRGLQQYILWASNIRKTCP